MAKIFLYLARRDKTAIDVISVFNGDNCSPTRITDLNTLGLSVDLLEQVRTKVENNKMLFELWIESSDDYETLKKTLRNRGFKIIPNHFKGIKGSSNIKINSFKKPSMIRRNFYRTNN